MLFYLFFKQKEGNDKKHYVWEDLVPKSGYNRPLCVYLSGSLTDLPAACEAGWHHSSHDTDETAAACMMSWSLEEAKMRFKPRFTCSLNLWCAHWRASSTAELPVWLKICQCFKDILNIQAQANTQRLLQKCFLNSTSAEGSSVGGIRVPRYS